MSLTALLSAHDAVHFTLRISCNNIQLAICGTRQQLPKRAAEKQAVENSRCQWCQSACIKTVGAAGSPSCVFLCETKWRHSFGGSGMTTARHHHRWQRCATCSACPDCAQRCTSLLPAGVAGLGERHVAHAPEADGSQSREEPGPNMIAWQGNAPGARVTVGNMHAASNTVQLT